MITRPFPYRVKDRWYIADEARPFIKSLVFDVLDIEIDRMILTELKLDVQRPASVLHKFTANEQIKLIKKLRHYLDDDVEMSVESEKYIGIFEELLYFLITDSVQAIANDPDFSEDIWEDWKDAISLTIELDEDEEYTDQVALSFVKYHLWHHKDWHFINVEDSVVKDLKKELNASID